MTAKEYLSQAWSIDDRIDRMIEERDRLWEKLTAGRMSRLTGMPRGGNSDNIDTLMRVMELTDEINKRINELCRLKREITETIDQVDDSRYRDLLELRYRNYLGWEQIAERMGYDVRHIYRLHGDALMAVKLPKDVMECHA